MINIRKEANWKKWSQIVLLAVLVILAFIFAINFKITAFKTFLDKNEKLSLALCLGVYVLLGITFVPSDPLTILLLTWKGPLIAILLATIGNTLAAMTEFRIGGSVGDLTNFADKKEKLPFHLNKLPIDSPAFLFLARMIPGFGSKFVSLAGGVYQVPLLTYIWTTVAANLLGAIVFVMGSFGILQLAIH